jgi:hypothetical protein
MKTNRKIKSITLLARTFIFAGWLVLALNAAAFAQQKSTSIPVKFDTGKTSKTLSGSVSHSANTYILAARKGQTLTVKIISLNGASFNAGFNNKEYGDFVELTTGRTGTWSWKLQVTTDYFVTVTGGRGSVGSYTIKFTIK